MILDRLPAVIVLDVKGKTVVEAEVCGTDVMMYLLSQDCWVKVLAPDDLVGAYKKEPDIMRKLYE